MDPFDMLNKSMADEEAMRNAAIAVGGFAPGAGLLDAFGGMPAVGGGMSPSLMQNMKQGNYFDSVMQMLGAGGDAAMATVVGLPIGITMKSMAATGKGAKAARNMANAPQAKALELARQRGALPIDQGGLGLPVNNTGMDRAKAMNFQDAFHETEAAKLEQLSKSDEFNVSNPQGGAGDPLTPMGVFTKPTGQRIGISRQNSEVQMPLMISPSGPTKSFTDRSDLLSYINQYPEVASAVKAADDLDMKMAKHLEDMEDRAADLYEQGKYKAADKLLEANAYDDSPVMKIFDQQYKDLSMDAKTKLTDLFKSQGIGNVHIKKDTADGGLFTESNIVLDPSNVRSRFAAFDPFRRNEPNLLAGAIPFTPLLATDEEQRNSLMQSLGMK